MGGGDGGGGGSDPKNFHMVDFRKQDYYFLARTVFMSERYLEFLLCQSLPTEILNIPWSLVEVAEIT